MPACQGKARYTSIEAADAAVVRIQKKRDEPKRRSKRLNAYFCYSCRFFHIGHRHIAEMPKES